MLINLNQVSNNYFKLSLKKINNHFFWYARLSHMINIQGVLGPIIIGPMSYQARSGDSVSIQIILGPIIIGPMSYRARSSDSVSIQIYSGLLLLNQCLIRPW